MSETVVLDPTRLVIAALVGLALLLVLITQTSHIKKWVRTLKNQYFSAQISFPTNIYAQHNACCMYFGSR